MENNPVASLLSPKTGVYRKHPSAGTFVNHHVFLLDMSRLGSPKKSSCSDPNHLWCNCTRVSSRPLVVVPPFTAGDILTTPMVKKLPSNRCRVRLFVLSRLKRYLESAGAHQDLSRSLYRVCAPFGLYLCMAFGRHRAVEHHAVASSFAYIWRSKHRVASWCLRTAGTLITRLGPRSARLTSVLFLLHPRD